MLSYSMFKILLVKIKKIVKFIINAPVQNGLMSNALNGWPDSQLELAKFHLIETQNFVEAYAWADVACCRDLPGAQAVKNQAESMLKPSEIKEAWDLSREYKQCFIPG